MKKMLRWGILGTGNIANQFARDVSQSERCELAAVGSRQKATAQAFAKAWQVPYAHGSYEALLHDPHVDAVYVSLPNSLHHEWTIAALRAGKHVLCEKPVASDAGECEEMFDVAQKCGCVLIEAFMYRSHPMMKKMLQMVRQGAVGQVRIIRANFAFRTWTIENNTRFSKRLAGGALMDIGCYCTDFARLIAQSEPVAVHCEAEMHESGVDEYATGTMRFADGILASFVCGLTVQADNTSSILGDEGYIDIPIPWKPPVTGAQFCLGQSIRPQMDQHRHEKQHAATPKPGQQCQWVTVDAGKPLYALEADDFAAVIFDHAEPAVTREQSIGNMRVLDELRRQIGVV